MLGHAILLPRGLLLELVRLCLPLSVGDFEAVWLWVNMSVIIDINISI